MSVDSVQLCWAVRVNFITAQQNWISAAAAVSIFLSLVVKAGIPWNWINWKVESIRSCFKVCSWLKWASSTMWQRAGPSETWTVGSRRWGKCTRWLCYEDISASKFAMMHTALAVQEGEPFSSKGPVTSAHPPWSWSAEVITERLCPWLRFRTNTSTPASTHDISRTL